jgi:hypothetical protein
LYLYLMATTQIFAYNVGPSIAGTTQSGNFAIGTPTSGFTNSPQFWNGPDEDLGYVIAQPVSGGTQPTPVGSTAYVGFFRTDGKTENKFVELASAIAGQTFSGSTSAINWLDANGYYTTFSGGGIVTRNLQLYLNAGDSDSYPGTGTTWTDLSPNAYQTTLINGVGYSSSDGGTLTFAGTQYVDTNQSITAQSFSVSAWFKTNAVGIKMIISKETTAGWPWNYRIWMNGGQLVGDIAQSGGVSTAINSPSSSYNNNVWYNVMFTRNDSTLRLYVNGIEIANSPDTLTGSIANSQEVWIARSAYTGGGASPSGSYQFIGNISEIMVYNDVLTDSEVLQNFDATKTRFGY